MRKVFLLLPMMAAMAFATASARADVRETQVETSGPMGPLRGTELAPVDTPAAIVLIVPGSGPTDRDGNSPLGIKAATYKRLAEQLAALGLTSVRIDKRGMFGSSQAVADANAVTLQDYASDVRNWVGFIRESRAVPCVWVLGHSEGGLVALMAAADTSHVCGLVLVATPGRPAGQVLREQLSQNPASAPLLQRAFEVIAELEGGRRVAGGDIPPLLMSLFHPRVQGYLISLLAFDPATAIKAYAGPVLILQGDRDLQVGEKDAQRLAAASPSARLVRLRNTNHALKLVETEDRGANMRTYADPTLPLAPDVAASIVDFISMHGARDMAPGMR